MTSPNVGSVVLHELTPLASKALAATHHGEYLAVRDALTEAVRRHGAIGLTTMCAVAVLMSCEERCPCGVVGCNAPRDGQFSLHFLEGGTHRPLEPEAAPPHIRTAARFVAATLNHDWSTAHALLMAHFMTTSGEAMIDAGIHAMRNIFEFCVKHIEEN
jgi:hypothetical protein